MFAVVRTGGKQYRVAPGDKIVVEKMDGNAGDRVTLGDVLLAGEGSDLKSTDGLKVAAEIIAQAKGEKVTVFKKRRRHNYRRKKGHRQQHTILRIVAIGDHKHVPSKAEGAETKAKTAKPEAAPAKAEAPAKSEAPAKAEAPQKAQAPVKAEAPKAEKPKAEKKAAPAKAGKAAPAKAEKPSTKNAAPAKGAAKKSSKSKK
jgi:large subunit ribosomal protein L21